MTTRPEGDDHPIFKGVRASGGRIQVPKEARQDPTEERGGPVPLSQCIAELAALLRDRKDD